jgi:antitoxin MazE
VRRQAFDYGLQSQHPSAAVGEARRGGAGELMGLTNPTIWRIFYVDTTRRCDMETHVQKWGNSLALRIPKPLADEVGLRENSPVELWLRDNTLVITPVVKPAFDLAQLLAQVTADNLHREVDTGPAIGGEAW